LSSAGHLVWQATGFGGQPGIGQVIWKLAGHLEMGRPTGNVQVIRKCACQQKKSVPPRWTNHRVMGGSMKNVKATYKGGPLKGWSTEMGRPPRWAGHQDGQATKMGMAIRK